MGTGTVPLRVRSGSLQLCCSLSHQLVGINELGRGEPPRSPLFPPDWAEIPIPVESLQIADDAWAGEKGEQEDDRGRGGGCWQVRGPWGKWRCFRWLIPVLATWLGVCGWTVV